MGSPDLKSDLELFRGESITQKPSTAADIPCCETSLDDLLCRTPLVSVVMTTYNHGAYIRRAIDGVMMQQTNFEFELIIGEDCSTDDTREICFEYQRRHPERIRVLWWHENVSKLGGNGARCHARVRGEFIALCEGDDFWTDPLKLQKQVDALRAHPTAGVCFTNALTHKEATGDDGVWPALPWEGLVLGKTAVEDIIDNWRMDGSGMSAHSTPITCTAIFRRSVMVEAERRYEIFSWQLALGDTTRWLALASLSDVYVLPERTGCYRIGSTSSAVRNNGFRVMRDGAIVRAYFSMRALGRTAAQFKDNLRAAMYYFLMEGSIGLSPREQRALGRRIFRSEYLSALFHRTRFYVGVAFLRMGILTPYTKRKLYRFFPVIRKAAGARKEG